ncbi:MAG: hypothetical protein NUV60_02865 [Patescibacteria group bacterium]|nr:hypothetical protein [Patescibacteria group bacterium]
MVDVSGGKMTLKEVEGEIRLMMNVFSPRRMVVDIRRVKARGGYHTTIWIPKKDFEKKKK